MQRYFFSTLFLALLVISGGVLAYGQQTRPTPTPTTQQQTTQAQRSSTATFDLSEYGVRITPDQRLIIMMAALDAAGFDPTPAGREPTLFRQQVRKDQEGLPAELRARLRTFYERNKLPAPATPAEQAARYVSLAYALGPAPTLEAPARTEDLPGGLLEVLDFAPLVREFYRQSGIEGRLPSYTRIYQAEGDRLRQPTAEMLRSVLSYLHTQPLITYLERVPVKSPTPAGGRNKNQQQTFTTRERERRFFIVPDLLAAPGAINFRIIADDYYTIVPLGTNPTSSELRRAYLQYVIDPLILRYNRDIAARRDQIKQLLAERTNAGGNVSPDVFLSVARSLVAATDVRLEELSQLDAINREMRSNLANARDQAARDAIIKDAQRARQEIADEAIAQLAENYERGAVLAFYFADQLRGIEASGFDIANFFADMMASFDAARESRRPAEYKEARARALAAREARLTARTNAASTSEETNNDSTQRNALVKQLVEVDQMLRLKNYIAAEEKLRALLQEYPGEARIFFALGQAASLSAQDAISEEVQAERLNRALAHYRMAIDRSSADTDRALRSRAHEARGRILEFLERKDDAIKEFDAAIQIGDVQGGAYSAAVAGKKRLTEQK